MSSAASLLTVVDLGFVVVVAGAVLGGGALVVGAAVLFVGIVLGLVVPTGASELVLSSEVLSGAIGYNTELFVLTLAECSPSPPPVVGAGSVGERRRLMTIRASMTER